MAILRQMPKGLNHQTTGAYAGLGAENRGRKIRLQLLQARQAGSGFPNTSFDGVAAGPNEERLGDGPAPIAHLAKIFKLLRKHGDAPAIPTVFRNTDQHLIGAEHSFKRAGRVDQGFEIGDHGLGFVQPALLVMDACEHAARKGHGGGFRPGMPFGQPHRVGEIMFGRRKPELVQLENPVKTASINEGEEIPPVLVVGVRDPGHAIKAFEIARLPVAKQRDI